ncbi:MAG: FAD-dependent oxidoreductase [Nitrospirae bacterium]|nr:FAD-dependent oxidoreductase [Nitrospirota bacterium]
MKKFIIIGAGPTGLATALGLSERGCEVRVYEAAPVVGGLAASIDIDGMMLDYGPHIFHTHDEDMKNYWQKTFGDLLVEVDFCCKNYKDGVYLDYPLSYEAIEKFPADLRDQVKKELSECRPENLKRARNFRECVSSIVGPTLQKLFFEGYTEKLWGISTDRMSANWAPKRIEIRQKHLPFWHGQFSAIGKYGSGRVMERLREQIELKGNSVFLDHKVTKINITDSRVDGIIFNNGEKIDVGDAIVISTIPLRRLCDVTGIKCDLKFNSIILAFLVFDRPHVFDGNFQSIYYAHDDYCFYRVTEQKKFTDLGYPPDKTVLTFEISYNKKPDLAQMDEQELVRKVLEQFCSTGLAEEKDFEKGSAVKLPIVNAILEHGYEEELARINSMVRMIKNLHTCGGSAEFHYGDMQTMFFKARDLVDLLTSEHYVINRNIKTGMPFRFNEEVRLCNYTVGKDHPSLIMAEAGLNHNNDLEMAVSLIDEARKCGCEIVKFQTFSAESRVSKTAKGAKYADKTLEMEETDYDMFKRLELSCDDHATLFEYAGRTGMPIISTPFDERSVDILCSMGVRAFKIASFDLVNLPFLRYVASKRLPIILSTGMSSLAEIEEALDAIASEENPNVILLHCVSNYPADPVDANLRAINTMKNTFKVPVGYSDHSVGPLISIMAMTLGANMIERHFTLDKRLDGPDHILSSDPVEMAGLVRDRDIIFSALGTGIKRPSPSEYDTINRQRKSIFAMKAIMAGENLSIDNVTIKGPGHGLSPRFLGLLLGKKAVRDVEVDQPLTWDDVLIS